MRALFRSLFELVEPGIGPSGTTRATDTDMRRKKKLAALGPYSMISSEVAERIRYDHILLRDEARLVRDLARVEGSRELTAHADSLERMVKDHVSLVEGVLDAVVPEGGDG